MATSFVTSVLLSCVDRNGAFHPEQISEVNQPGVFSFGKFKDDEYSWAELPLFACLGIWGGLVGAAFNTLYIRLYAKSFSLSLSLQCLVSNNEKELRVLGQRKELYVLERHQTHTRTRITYIHISYAWRKAHITSVSSRLLEVIAI